MRSPRQQFALVAIFLLAVLIAIPMIATWWAVRQARLNSALITAVKRQDTRAVVSLLKQGADANAREGTPAGLNFWHNRWDLLHRHRLAAPAGRTALVLAIEGVAQRDPDGSYIVPHEDLPLVQTLLEHGADVNARHKGPLGPLLDFAISVDEPATVHLLLAHGADTRIRPESDDEVYAPVVDAAWSRHEHPEIVADVLAHGADINQRDEDGNTALFTPAGVGFVKIVRALVAHCIDVSIRNKRGETALDEALRQYKGLIGAQANGHHVDSQEVRDQREIVRLIRAAEASVRSPSRSFSRKRPT
jgi:hypothetical protein